MKTLTQEEMESLNVGDVVEVLIEKKEGFIRSGWVTAVVIPSTYYGCIMFYTFLRVSGSRKLRDTLENRLKDDDDYNHHRLWVGRNRHDFVRRPSKAVFPWSWRAKG